jgi:hypothetical protein
MHGNPEIKRIKLSSLCHFFAMGISTAQTPSVITKPLSACSMLFPEP